MPVTKAALKKQRQDKKRTQINNRTRKLAEISITAVKKNATAGNLTKAFSQIDKAAKKGLIHKNKASRMKSQLSKLGPKKTTTPKAMKKTTRTAKTSRKASKQA